VIVRLVQPAVTAHTERVLGHARAKQRAGGPALAASLVAHALLFTLLVSARGPLAPTRIATTRSFVDVELTDALAASRGGSASPRLPEAVPSPVVIEADHNELPVAPGVVRHRVLAPSRPEPDRAADEIASAESLDSAPEVSPAAASPTVAPLTDDQTRSSVTDPGSGTGVGGGAGDGVDPIEGTGETATAAAARPTAPTDRCGDDPLDGIWEAHGHDQYGHFDVTLELDRNDEDLTGRVHVRLWYGSPVCAEGGRISEFDEAITGEPVRGSPSVLVWSLGCEPGRCNDNTCDVNRDPLQPSEWPARAWYFRLGVSGPDRVDGRFRGARIHLDRVRCLP
jgi:hypothetical protein